MNTDSWALLSISTHSHSQGWHWTVPLCFESCYDSQKFANQTGPAEEFCLWPRSSWFQMVVSGSGWPLWHLPDGRISSVGLGEDPTERLFPSWLKLCLKEFRCELRNFLARKVGKYDNRSQRESHGLLEIKKKKVCVCLVFVVSKHSPIN